METAYDLSGIPDGMKCLRGWLYWVGNKVPRTLRNDPLTGRCNHTNPYCLASLDEVIARIEHFQCRHGLAFSFRPEFALTYIDLDDCRNPETGELTDFASQIVRSIDSYTEVSINKKGLHIVARGQVERPRMHTKTNHAGRQIEIKPYGFYMTVSGNHLAGTPRSIEDRQAELTAIYQEVFSADSTKSKERIERWVEPQRGFRELDCSACDYALCRDLARTGMSCDEIEQALIDHPIMDRDKWTNRPEYRKATILAALNSLKKQNLGIVYIN